MFPRQTVFVLGAGASCDLGLPSGDQLREKLLRVLHQDGTNLRFGNGYLNRAIAAQSQQKGGNGWPRVFQQYLDAASRIRSGLPLAQSIDNYLDAHRNDAIVQELGKLAIATAILDAERNSALNEGSIATVALIDRFELSPKVASSWYLPLMRLITSGKGVDDVHDLFANVAFIVFNYDRCLEHFLINALMAYYDLTPQQAVECMGQLSIVHPYGRVGYLPWQLQPITAAFGNLGSDLNLIAKGIRTFTESSDEGVVAEVRRLVQGAETLLVLGYGFLDQNNDLLRVSESNVRRVFASSKGISDDDVPIVRQTIYEIVAKSDVETHGPVLKSKHAAVFIDRQGCRELMDHHRLRLSRVPTQRSNSAFGDLVAK